MTTPNGGPARARPFLTLAAIRAMSAPRDVDTARILRVLERETRLAMGGLLVLPKPATTDDEMLSGQGTYVLGAADWLQLTASYGHGTDCAIAEDVDAADLFVARLLRGVRDIDDPRTQVRFVHEAIGTRADVALPPTQACSSPGHCALGAMAIDAGRSDGYIAIMPDTPRSWCEADALLFWKAFGIHVGQASTIYKINDCNPSLDARKAGARAIVEERRERVGGVVRHFTFEPHHSALDPIRRYL